MSSAFKCTKCAEKRARGTTCQGCGGQHCDGCCIGNSQTLFGFPVKYDDTLPENVVKFQPAVPDPLPINVGFSANLFNFGVAAGAAEEALKRLSKCGKVGLSITTDHDSGTVVGASLIPIPAEPASSGVYNNHSVCTHGSVCAHTYDDNMYCPGPPFDSHSNQSPAVRPEPPTDRQFALAEDDE